MKATVTLLTNLSVTLCTWLKESADNFSAVNLSSGFNVCLSVIPQCQVQSSHT